ncbi:MAG: NusG domain II-containing protein [Bacilli bacterium]|nr:NusG domain II-containing protein [Bacilli bacterium]
MDKKTLRNDIILIASLLLAAIISLIVVFSLRSKKDNKYANVYVQNEISFTIDLQEDEEKDYHVYAFNSDKVLLTIHKIDHGVKVSSSTCPHKDCVQTGYVNVTNKPIICAYNQVYIIIETKAAGTIR